MSESTELVPQEETEVIERVSSVAQAKNDAVANLTMQAYENASTLKLTPEEQKALVADFPDEAFQPGAGGNRDLIYIEHAFLRERLSEVLGLGQWAFVCRSRWTEPYRTSQGKEGHRVYVECMLIVRGCYVAEAVGSMDYLPGNMQTNFGDAIEGAKSSAFRRCAKEMGIGLQVWKKGFTEGWWQRRNNPPQRGNSHQQKQQGNISPIVMSYLDFFAGSPPVDTVNEECVKGFSNLSQEDKRQCWPLFLSHSEARGWEFDNKAKAFKERSRV